VGKLKWYEGRKEDLRWNTLVRPWWVVVASGWNLFLDGPLRGLLQSVLLPAPSRANEKAD